MAHCIPNVYGNADRKLVDQIERERDKLVINGTLPEFWQVGAAICTRLDNGYYHAYILEKNPYTREPILRDYRINRKGEMVYTESYYSVPTKESFLQWCRERDVEYREENKS